jgi:hypothetical protein
MRTTDILKPGGNTPEYQDQGNSFRIETESPLSGRKAGRNNRNLTPQETTLLNPDKLIQPLGLKFVVCKPSQRWLLPVGVSSSDAVSIHG